VAKKRTPPDDGKVSPQVISRIIMEPNDGMATYYVNYAEAASTLSDFALLCGQIPPKLNSIRLKEAQASGAVTIDAAVQIVFPVGMIPGLIDALMKQKEIFEKLTGVKIQEPKVSK
jgi:hypothetical protein